MLSLDERIVYIHLHPFLPFYTCFQELTCAYLLGKMLGIASFKIKSNHFHN